MQGTRDQTKGATLSLWQGLHSSTYVERHAHERLERMNINVRLLAFIAKCCRYFRFVNRYILVLIANQLNKKKKKNSLHMS